MDRAALGQALNLREELVAAGRPNRSGRAMRPTSVTVHNTSNTSPGADAAAHSRFIRNTGNYKLKDGRLNWVSWHYTVDDKCAIKHVPINERAIHAGAANGSSIAIEVCMNSGIDQAAANLRAARLVAALMHDLKLGPDALKSHKDWTGKACPVLLLPRWDDFRRQVQAILAAITAPPTESVLLPAEELVVPPGADAEAPELLEPGLGDIDHEALAAAIRPD